MDKKVSIILTTKDAFSHVKNSLIPISRSRWDNIEIVISAADDYDYSSLRDLFPDLKITQIPFMGLEMSRSKAFAEAVKFSTGEYITSLDAHDFVDDAWLEVMMEAALKYGVAFSHKNYVDLDGNVVREVRPVNREVSVRTLCDAMGDFGFLAKRELFEKTEGVFAYKTLVQLKAIQRAPNFTALTVRDVVYSERIHPSSDSATFKLVNEQYEALAYTLENSPETLGFGPLAEDFLADCREFFRIRVAVNSAFENLKKMRPDLDYQHFIENNKVTYKKFNGRFSLDH